MEHREALESKAAERYLLEELSPEDREGFEEHYFGCPECARNVADTEALLAVARAVFRERDAVRTGGLSRAFRLPAKALVLVALGSAVAYAVAEAMAWYQHLADSPRQMDVASHVFPALALHGGASGDTSTITVPPNSPYFGLEVHVKPSLGAGHYEVELQREDRTRLFLLNSAPPAGNKSIHVLVTAPKIPSGAYLLLVRGIGVAGPEPALDLYRFRVERR